MLAEDGHFKECAEGKEDTEKSLVPERGRKLTAGRVIA